jgi:hypothetical protein
MLGIPTDAAVPIVERYEHLPPIEAHVVPLVRRAA